MNAPPRCRQPGPRPGGALFSRGLLCVALTQIDDAVGEEHQRVGRFLEHLVERLPVGIDPARRHQLLERVAVEDPEARSLTSRKAALVLVEPHVKHCGGAKGVRAASGRVATQQRVPIHWAARPGPSVCRHNNMWGAANGGDEPNLTDIADPTSDSHRASHAETTMDESLACFGSVYPIHRKAM